MTNSHYDDFTYLQGVIPLGGCKVEKVERGPGKSKFGLKISHTDFVAGRTLVLAAEKEEEQAAWFQALNDCSRVYVRSRMCCIDIYVSNAWERRPAVCEHFGGRATDTLTDPLLPATQPFPPPAAPWKMPYWVTA